MRIIIESVAVCRSFYITGIMEKEKDIIPTTGNIVSALSHIFEWCALLNIIKSN